MTRPTLRQTPAGPLVALGVLILLTLAAQARAEPDVDVKVRGNLLVLEGARGEQLAVTIVPLLDGLRIVPGPGTTLNRAQEPVTVRNVPRNWVMRFGRSTGVEIRIDPPAEGVPTLRPRTVAFIGARATNRFFIDGMEIRKDLKLDMRRARDTVDSEFRLERSSIDGRLQVRQNRVFTDITCQDLVVGRFTKFAHKRSRRAGDRRATYSFTRCDLAALNVKVPVASAFVRLIDCDVAGDVSLRGDVSASLTDTRIDGDFEMRTGSGTQTVELDGVVVTRESFLTLGAGADVVTLTDSSFGVLELQGGPENDALATTGVTVGAGSLYDGGSGDLDRWTTPDESLLPTTSVELIGPPAATAK